MSRLDISASFIKYSPCIFNAFPLVSFLAPLSFLNFRALTLPVVQFSFAIFYPAMFRTLPLFLHYHTFIFQQTLRPYDAFSYIHLPLIRKNSCLLAASAWVYLSVRLVLPLFSVSCFFLTYKGLQLILQRMFAPYKHCPFEIFSIFKVSL